ncbi:unnamed protein product [Lota lota]
MSPDANLDSSGVVRGSNARRVPLRSKETSNIRHIGRHEALARSLMKTPAPLSAKQLSVARSPYASPLDGNQTAHVPPPPVEATSFALMQALRALWVSLRIHDHHMTPRQRSAGAELMTRPEPSP